MSDAQTNNYHHGNLQSALIETALKLMEERGGCQFTLREVARIAGVTHTAPYRHFADKASLLSELAKLGFDRMSLELSKNIHTKPKVGDQLIAAAKSYIEFGTKNPALYQLMFSNTLGTKNDVHLNERAMATLNLLITILELGQREGVIKKRPIKGLAAACWAQVHGLTLLSIHGLLVEEKVGKNAIDSALQNLIDGVKA
jgi:AcrR family transcriptional regulator